MGSWAGRILFIDGFAGPGKYEGGEDGSPVIALKSLLEHRHKNKISAEVKFIFIEKDRGRCEYLDALMDDWEEKLPTNCSLEVVLGKFDETMSRALDALDEQAKHLAPSFVMIDPFGVSGTPMSVIERILKNSQSEVYVSFMYESMNRFKDTPDFAPHLDALFGCEDWRDGIDMDNPVERKNFFYGLYEDQLGRAGAEQVVRFELYENNRLVYAIFFGTKHVRGSDRMKQAIWKIAPFGDFTFRGTKSKQLTLGIAVPDFEPLKRALRKQFCHKGSVGIQEVLDFVGSDQTDYHTGQVRRHALVPMETADKIKVDEDTRNKKRTYPKGTHLRFL